MSIDPKFVERTADVLNIFFQNIICKRTADVLNIFFKILYADEGDDGWKEKNPGCWGTSCWYEEYPAGILYQVHAY